MMILGLDISTKTGWAIADTAIVTPTGGERIVAKGVIHVPHTQGLSSSSNLRFQRYDSYVEKFRRTCLDKRIDFAVVEGYGYANKFTLAVLLEIGTLLRRELWVKGISWIEVPPTSLKKFVTGKGNAKKNLMLLNVNTRFKEFCETDDEADAVSLAYYGLAAYGHKVPLPASHLSAIKRIE